MTSVEEGDVEKTISMLGEEEKIYLVAEVTEVPNSGTEMMASKIVVIIEAGPTTGHGITTSDITAMSPQVVKDRERMTKM